MSRELLKTTIALLTLLLSLPVFAEGYEEGVSYQQYGSVILGSDGSTATTVDNQTIYDNGSSSYSTGNQTIHSDGAVGTRIGNTLSYPTGQACASTGDRSYCY